MSMPEHHTILNDIVGTFEALASKIEHAIEEFAQDDSGAVDLAALHRARDAAVKGANIAGDAMSDLIRAID